MIRRWFRLILWYSNNYRKVFVVWPKVMPNYGFQQLKTRELYDFIKNVSKSLFTPITLDRIRYEISQYLLINIDYIAPPEILLVFLTPASHLVCCFYL